jgi:hypothetical protein
MIEDKLLKNKNKSQENIFNDGDALTKCQTSKQATRELHEDLSLYF